VKPRLLVRIRRSIRRLDPRSRATEPEAVDRAWHKMLSRLDAEERERRLRAAEAALNGSPAHGA